MLINGQKLEELAKEVFVDSPPAKVGSSSVDVRLGGRFLVGNHNSLIRQSNGKVEYRGLEELNIKEGEEIVFLPGRLYIAHSIEYVRLPKDVGAFLLLRSTTGRRGLDHLHAGWLEPGWEGQITFELAPVVKTAFIVGEPIAQLVFIRAEGESQYVGQYQGQVGPTAAKMVGAYS